MFCRIVAGEIPATVVLDTERTLAFRDINPQAATHVLVVPKQHHEDAVALAEFDALRLSAKGSYDRDPDDCIHVIDRAGRRLRIEVREVATVDMAP